MRTHTKLALLIATMAAAPACIAASNESGPNEGSGDRDEAASIGIVEGTPEALGVLKLASEADLLTLDSSKLVGLTSTAAKSIVQRRDADSDHTFTTLAELDAVPNVGPSAFAKLLAFALAHGYVEPEAPTPLVCEPHEWLTAVPASGEGMMAFGSKAYLFANDGKSWTIIENESATTQALPFPDGVTSMLEVTAEIAPSGRPLVKFQSGNQHYATFFDGKAFVGTVALGWAYQVHADAKEHVYADTTTGLIEIAPGGTPIVRGSMPFEQASKRIWTVGADGTVYLLHPKSRPSTIHPGDTAIDLLLTRLPHASLTWSSDVKVTSNEGQGFSGAAFAAAVDGSLHIAYRLPYGGYYYRSHDGNTWEESLFIDILSKATLVDPAVPKFDSDPARVGGAMRLLAPQDYDHVSITLNYKSGSMGIPSSFFLRKCDPFSGQNGTWPAERFAFSGLAFDPGSVAVNEHGLATILTPYGVRQDVTIEP